MEKVYRLVINSGEKGQSVDHIHVHILSGRAMGCHLDKLQTSAGSTRLLNMCALVFSIIPENRRLSCIVAIRQMLLWEQGKSFCAALMPVYQTEFQFI